MSNFGDFIWFFLVSFLFIAYLMILFSIIGDLFRDHKQSGWVKAIWIIALVVVPFITAFVYLIVRGQGMAKRQAAAVADAQADAEAYIKKVAGTSHADELVKANALKESGAITDAEFTSLKKKILESA